MNSTPMEKVKAYHSIKSFLNEEDRKKVAEMLQLNETDVTKRIWGKDNEQEFILMIYLLGNCKSIYAFEEGISKLTDSETSDLLIELKNGKRIIVEIKSTVRHKYSISEKVLKAKQDFAKVMNADLYFAVKVGGYWALYDDKYIESKNRKIDVAEDYFNSKFNSIFGDHTFMLPRGLEIQSIYSKNLSKNLGISHRDYGKLVKYTIKYNNSKILTVNSQEHQMYGLIFLYENFQDMASNMKQDIIKIDGDRTMIKEIITSDITTNLSIFMLSPIKHMISEMGSEYEVGQYLVRLIDDKEKISFDKNSMLYSLLFLAERDYPIKEVVGRDIYLYKDMITKNI
jgi:Holliday junction resolvase|nr:hypothetical protein [uncultured Romboutsia sp.]DAE87477.1 MAG TPA: holliday junction resolvase [Caudoviricetes sp.]